MTKPIHLWSHAFGPNPWKVVIVLHELGLPYEATYVDAISVKAQPYTDVNPNGRVPAIHDPNTDITIFESGAILEYLVEQYDTKHLISYPPTSFAEKYHTKQWLHFQMSGQGPYFGQAVWFTRFHPEKVPSAIERYRNEARRVTQVLDKVLSKSEYLVGDKCTYADLAFIPWYAALPNMFGDEEVDFQKDYPNYGAWMKKLLARPAVQKAFEEKAAAMAKASN